MNDRLIVCFRSLELFVEPATYLAAARILGERAAALGGRLSSWGATVYGYEFDPDALEDVIDLVLSVAQGSSSLVSVGISEGTLESAREGGGKRALKWGVPLVHATALARAARPGEVLVDPTLRAVRRGELLTTGSRVGVYGRLRLRGLLLDLRYPWCNVLAEKARSLVRPEHVGHGLDQVPIEPGSVAVLRGKRGTGGSRLLDEIEQRNAPAPVLRIMPHSFGEPLGGLRRAVRAAPALQDRARAHSEHFAQSLEAFVSGEGLDPDSCAELIVELLSPKPEDDEIGLATVDDAAEVDADTLEVLARALELRPDLLRIVVRLGESDPVPKPLATAPRGPELVLEPLPVEHAAEVAQASLRGELDDKSATRWGNRGGRIPLGVVEAVRDALETGEIVWENGRASARLRSSGTGDAHAPKHWVLRRLERLDESARRVLEALSVLGGQAEEGDLRAVLRKRDDLFIDPTASLAVLEARAFVLRSEPDFLTVPSATHRDAILSTLAESDFRAWHAAACAASAESDRPLAASTATVHAVLAGDLTRAKELARRTAAATRAIGLEATEAAFAAFASSGDLEALTSRNLFSAQLDLARAAVAPPSEPQAAASDAETELEDADIEMTEPAASTKASAELTDEPSEAVQALRKGDVDAVERMAEKVRLSDKGSPLAERLSAMANLARGETGDAIRRLRQAAEEARQIGSRERCRTSLALGVALAASGRYEEALLEALDALARARETEDTKGEHACLLFLAQLSATAGHPAEAAAWANLAANP